jgi:hypothetical protein
MRNCPKTYFKIRFIGQGTCLDGCDDAPMGLLSALGRMLGEAEGCLFRHF